MFKQLPFRMTFDFLRGHKLLLAVALATRAIWEVIPMQVPILVGAIVDGLGGKVSKAYGIELNFGSIYDTVNFAGICLGGVAITYAVAAYTYTVTGARLGELFVGSLRKQVTNKMIRLPLATQQRLGGGELLDRALQDTERVRKFIDQVVIRTLTNVLRIGYPLIMLFVLDFHLALLAVSVIPMQWFISVKVQRRLFTVTQEKLRARSKLTLDVKETIDGAETIQCINGEKQRISVVDRGIDNVERYHQESARLTALIRGVIWLATATGVALVWWRGSLMVADGAITLGKLIVFTGFMEFAYRPFRFFPKVVKSFEQGRASLTRIHELLSIDDVEETTDQTTDLQLTEGRVQFKNVCMAYGADMVLDNVNVMIEPRQLTAIVGPSGCGKSSLMRLISRLYERNYGEVFIDGQSVDDVSLHSLRRRIAFVPQSPVVFSGTLRDNLAVGNPEATERQILQACTDGGAWEFIERLPEGLDTLVGPEGMQLSGGQAQRLAISRALVCQPGILLLDEPTSALDGRSQELVMDTLLELRNKVTVVLVGHRVSTFRNADQIVILDRGRVTASGTHDELMLESDAYFEIVTGESKRHVNATRAIVVDVD